MSKKSRTSKSGRTKKTEPSCILALTESQAEELFRAVRELSRNVSANLAKAMIGPDLVRQEDEEELLLLLVLGVV